MLGNVAFEPSSVGAVRCTPLKLEYSFTKAFPGSGMPLVSRTLTTTVTGLSISVGLGPRGPAGVGRCPSTVIGERKSNRANTTVRATVRENGGVTCSATQVPAEGER